MFHRFNRLCLGKEERIWFGGVSFHCCCVLFSRMTLFTKCYFRVTPSQCVILGWHFRNTLFSDDTFSQSLIFRMIFFLRSVRRCLGKRDKKILFLFGGALSRECDRRWFKFSLGGVFFFRVVFNNDWQRSYEVTFPVFFALVSKLALRRILVFSLLARVQPHT